MGLSLSAEAGVELNFSVKGRLEGVGLMLRRQGAGLNCQVRQPIGGGGVDPLR